MFAAPTLFGRPMTIFYKSQKNTERDSAEKLLDLGRCRETLNIRVRN
jgi:hypothetical protein